MTVTYTRVSNPPPAGNITLADDTEVDGSEGKVTHTGGFILAGGATNTSYYFRLLTDAQWQNEDGDVRIEYGSRFVMEAGSDLLFNGDDGVYRLELEYDGSWIAKGTSVNGCTVQGLDGANRMLYVNYRGMNVYISYVDFDNCSSPYIVGGFPYMRDGSPAIFINCTFGDGDGNYAFNFSLGLVYLKNCYIGYSGCTYGLYGCRNCTMILEDCTIEQSSAVGGNPTNDSSTIIYNDITWIDATPTYVNDSIPDLTSITEILCKKVTISETNNISGVPAWCYHENFEDFYNPANNDDLWNSSWMQNLTRLGLVNTMKLTDVNGEVSFLIPYAMLFYDKVTSTRTYYYLSKSGESYTHNGQYIFGIGGEDYRFQSIEYWGDSNQTWNVTLQEQADFDDILDCCNTSSAKIDEILDIEENKLTIDEDTSELCLWNDAGDAIIKRWPITDKDNLPVRLEGTQPANRGARTL